MAKTYRDIYNTVCWTLLEDSGLVFFSTQTDCVDQIQTVLLDFLERTGIVKDLVSISGGLVPGTAVYGVPDTSIQARGVMVDGVYLPYIAAVNLDNSKQDWTQESGSPSDWNNEYVSPNEFQVHPNPNITAPLQAYCTQGFVPAAPGSVNLNTTLPVILDSFVMFIEFGVLEKIFSTDGEAKDTARAKYCHARYMEGVNLAKAIMTEDILEDVSQ